MADFAESFLLLAVVAIILTVISNKWGVVE